MLIKQWMEENGTSRQQYQPAATGRKERLACASYYSELWKHHAKWKKPYRKDEMLYGFIYLKCPEWVMLGGRDWEMGSGHLTGMEFLWGKWIRDFVLCPYKHTKPIGCTFWRVKFMAFELYLNKKKNLILWFPHIGLNLVLCAIPCMEATRDPNQFALGSSVFWYRQKRRKLLKNTAHSLIRGKEGDNFIPGSCPPPQTPLPKSMIMSQSDLPWRPLSACALKFRSCLWKEAFAMTEREASLPFWLGWKHETTGFTLPWLVTPPWPAVWGRSGILTVADESRQPKRWLLNTDLPGIQHFWSLKSSVSEL